MSPMSSSSLSNRSCSDNVRIRSVACKPQESAMPWKAIVALVAAALMLPAPARGQSVADFYRGRQMQMLIGYSAGAGYDLYARVLARHMGKHIPGNPTLVPQNMPGAGS